MLEPPSPQLQQRLASLKLCTPKDLRRCRPRVRRLAYDLPAFDSVWIDALVQARKLTSFQARILESPQPQRLRIGPCLLVDRLGHSASAETFLARQLSGTNRCVIKRINLSSEDISDVDARLSTLISRWKGAAHPSVIVPHASNRLDADRSLNSGATAHGSSTMESGSSVDDDRCQIATISRYLLGPHLGELLIRRGRFPATVVADIGRQLLDAMAALASRKIVHGDVRLSNVRMTNGGVIVLVDTGIGPAVNPELVVTATCPPERYDGVAPELIGSGASPMPKSDLYALGCLLWQLLAARPVFPTGDPLAKLAAHQTQPIPDIREWAPDTPRWLAEAIGRLTAHDPNRRPASSANSLKQWGPPRPDGRRRLAKFRSLFNTSAPRVPISATSKSTSRWTVMLVLLFVVSGAVLALLDKGAQNQFLAIMQRVSGSISDTAGFNDRHETPIGTDDGDPSRQSTNLAGATNTPDASASRPLPAPDADGVILLKPNTTYAAAEISHVGPLTIRSQPFAAEAEESVRRPTILVRDKALKVWVEQLTVENVAFRRADETAPHSVEHMRLAPPPALLLVQAQNLVINGCRFQTHAPTPPERIDEESLSSSQSPAQPYHSVAITWKPFDSEDRSGLHLAIRNTLILGNSTALYLSGVPQSLECSNCLKVGAGAFVTLGTPVPAGRVMHVVLNRVTLRQSQAFLQNHMRGFHDTPGYMHIEARDCVFDLQRNDSALIEWIGTSPTQATPTSIEFNGEGCLANPGLKVAAFRHQTTGERADVDSTDMLLEGIVTAPFKFSGPPSTDASNSVIKSFQAPSSSSAPPGITAASLRFPHRPANSIEPTATP